MAAYKLRKTKEQTREAVLGSYVIEAIAYMEYQPSTTANIKCRRQLREVAQYLDSMDKAAKRDGANHD